MALSDSSAASAVSGDGAAAAEGAADEEAASAASSDDARALRTATESLESRVTTAEACSWESSVKSGCDRATEEAVPSAVEAAEVEEAEETRPAVSAARTPRNHSKPLEGIRNPPLSKERASEGERAAKTADARRLSSLP